MGTVTGIGVGMIWVLVRVYVCEYVCEVEVSLLALL